jgi:predicted lipid-binding transport protein (Tim44 family)
MPLQTDGDVAVVKPYYLVEKAYRMGHERFKDAEVPEDDTDLHESLSHFKEYAKWANTIAPKLRAMAGYADGGHGTYQQHRQVAAIHEGCEEDEPAEADLMDASDLYSTLVEAWDTGALDGYEDTFDPESVQHL